MLPNFIIAGAMKCGTVSLHRYLSYHPQIYMTPIHEVDFFVEERRWQQGLEWYKAHFPVVADAIGERSTSYTKFPIFQGVPKRMHSIIPKANIIYCFRDPVDRIVSHYIHEYATGRENGTIEQAVYRNFPDNQYIYYSRYYTQVEQYLAYYQTSQILLLDLKQLAEHRKETLREVFRFLGVDPEFNHQDFNQIFHHSSSKKRATWLKTNLGHVRGSYRLEKLFPRLFQSPIKRPEVSEKLRDDLYSILTKDYEKVLASETLGIVSSSKGQLAALGIGR